jgi:hypothetical protein
MTMPGRIWVAGIAIKKALLIAGSASEKPHDPGKPKRGCPVTASPPRLERKNALARESFGSDLSRQWSHGAAAQTREKTNI